MKKLSVVVVIVTAVLIVGLSLAKKSAISPAGNNQSANTAGTYCFSRSVAATPDVPYAVEEQIAITIDGDKVTGTKSGTQSGPDMTNGYDGTLSGTKAGDKLSLLFSYTIEGSEQVEREEYVLSDQTLIKHRYPLVERAGVLMPDMTKSFTEQIYNTVLCV